LLDFRCEAVLLFGYDAGDDDLATLAKQVPVVSVGRRVAASEVDVVRSADDVGVGSALTHLTSLGHEKIAFLDGGRGAVAAARRRGYRSAMRRAGLQAFERVLPGDHTEEGGLRAGRTLASDPAPPSAVICSNDRLAVGLLDSLARAGIDVPGTVSVVGYDDSMLAHLAHIDLTTVNQDAPAQARHAVAAAVSRLDDGRTDRREVVLEPHLVVRGSTGPA
jgi:DNA-binding LacI/PurR family transcriptional regulator